MKARGRRVALPLLMALALGACGSAPAAPAPAAPAAANPPPLVDVSVAVGVPVLSYAPLFVALDGHLFEPQGLRVREVQLEGGGTTMQALQAGSVQFLVSDTGTVAAARSRGLSVLAIADLFDNVTLNLVVGRRLAEARHLSRDLPLEQRLAALKGMKLGVTSAGSASDIFTRYYLKQAGLDPARDVQLVQVGSAGALLAALKAGEIDAFQLSPPTPDEAVAGGYGTVLISASEGDVPEFKGFAFEAASTTGAYAAAHPEVVRAFARGLAAGCDLLRRQPAEAEALLAKRFNKIDPAILHAALAAVTPAIPAGGRGSEQAWAKALEVEAQTGMVRGRVDPAEGGVWTNRYLP